MVVILPEERNGMPKKDYYSILGISRGTGLEKIKSCHPDKTHSAEAPARFLEIKEAT